MLLKYLVGGPEKSRPDDGGTEGPERGAGGAKRRGGWGLGRGAVDFSKNQRLNCTFSSIFAS